MGPNIIVLSKAGKPIFSRYGSEEELIPICGITQALLATASVVSQNESGIKFICAKNMKISFLTVGYITLLAVDDGNHTTEPYLHLLLEYVYSQIIFTLTDQMQKVFQRSPSFDMRGLLGATERVLEGLLLNNASIITGGVEVVPLDPSQLLHSSTKNIPDTLFVILVVNGKLVTMIQLPNREHQIHTMDLQLILNFVKHQPGLLDTESWIPICLPRFEPSKFVYGYINRIEDKVDLSLICIGVQHNTAQFELYRRASAVIKSSLGIKLDSPRQQAEVALSSMSSLANMTSSLTISNHCPLVEVISSSNLHLEELPAMIKEYCQLASTMHFLFRLDMFDPQKKGKSGNLIQFVQSSFQFPLIDSKAQQNVWNMYQKLSLRLRNGSARAEKSFSEMDRIALLLEQQQRSDNSNNTSTTAPSSNNAGDCGERILSQVCVSRDMFGKLPQLNGVSYFIKGSEMYIAINIQDCELYAVLSSTISVTAGASMCARLIGGLLTDRNVLFLDSIKTWT